MWMCSVVPDRESNLLRYGSRDMLVPTLLAFALQATPAEKLAAAVDLPDAAARAARAVELARDPEVSLAAWLVACRTFRPLEMRPTDGRVPLSVTLDVAGEPVECGLWLRVPTSGSRGSRPLLVALHGAGGSGRQAMATWRETAQVAEAVLLCPTDPGPNQGYTGKLEERQAVLAAIRWTRRHFDIDENRIWLTGYSRGGHLAYDLALRYPGVFAAVSPQAGSPRFDPRTGGNNLRFAGNLGSTQMRALIGSQEQETMRVSSHDLAERARALGVTSFELVELEGKGHAFDPHTGFEEPNENWASWFAKHARDPWAPDVQRWISRTDESDVLWASALELSEGVLDEVPVTIRGRGRAEVPDDVIRRQIRERVEPATAHLSIRRDEKGTFRFEAEGVGRARILLSEKWIPDNGRVVVRRGARRQRFDVEPGAETLLRTFVERFDRTFLPVAEIEFDAD